MTLHRYLFTEVIKPFLLISTVLLLLLITTEISDTLTRVLTGQYSNNAIWKIIGYYIPILLADLLPAAYFLACLTSLHRLSQDSERAILLAIGISDLKLAGYLLAYTALPVFMATLYLTNLAAPNSEKAMAEFTTAQKNRPITEILKPKQFYNINSLKAVVYADSANNKAETLNDVFLISNNGDSIRAIRAQTGATENLGESQNFNLSDGQLVTFSFQNQPTQNSAFEQMALNFSDAKTNTARLRNNSLNSIELKQKADRSSIQEIWKRFNKGLYIPLFCIWAVVLTRYKPRAAKVGAMGLGIAMYVFTDFFYATLNSAMKDLTTTTALNGGVLLWALAAIGLFLIANRRAG